MKNNFIVKYLDPLASLGASGVVGAGLSGLQSVLGIIQMISGDARMKKLSQRRTAYQTPDEIFDILQATQNRAQQGYDPVTLNYLTNQADRTFDQASGAMLRLGGDPNELSALLDQTMQARMKIGAENHALNMENFSKYLSAVNTVAENKAAEWKSREDIIKDQMQSAGADKQAGLQNVVSAANAFMSLLSSAKTAGLYGDTGNQTNRQVVESLQRGGIDPIYAPIGRTARWGG